MNKRLHLLVLFALCWYLGLHNGYLAIRNGQEAEPAYVFPYRAENYPAADMEALQHGIPITSRESLARLMEDYCS